MKPPSIGSSSDTRRVMMLAYPGVQILDVTGPLEVFHVASQLLEAGGRRPAAYKTQIVAETAGAIASSGGITIVADTGMADRGGAIDTLVVPGGAGSRQAVDNETLITWVRQAAGRARRVASVCTGALLLAEAGLLDGKRATTHWAFAGELARRYPRTEIEPDAVYVRDDTVYSSAGVTAGIDLALALVEEDHGRELALQIARWLVVFLRRPGGQSQFSTQLAAQMAEREPIRDIQAWIYDHVGDDLSIEQLALRAAMSPRNFARVFTREVGLTPARFVERVRIEAARRKLEESRASVDEIAETCGFGTAETMRRAFLRNVRVAPSDYRSRFHTLH